MDKERRWTMHAIKATWINGQILPSEPVDWPEGSELLVEPIVPSEAKIGLTEEEWRDDPESIAAWEAGIRSIEPPEYSDQERAEMARYREEYRRYNLEAVRRQMEAGEER
jgi:hypothetical protein